MTTWPRPILSLKDRKIYHLIDDMRQKQQILFSKFMTPDVRVRQDPVVIDAFLEISSSIRSVLILPVPLLKVFAVGKPAVPYFLGGPISSVPREMVIASCDDAELVALFLDIYETDDKVQDLISQMHQSRSKVER